MTQTDQITQWIRDAGQEPGADSVQLYSALCVEETGELLHCWKRHSLGRDLRADSMFMRKYGQDVTPDREPLIDAACDLIWVATGLIYSMGVDPTEAMARVIASNDSKRINGELCKDETGKVIKGPDYQPPNWEGLL